MIARLYSNENFPLPVVEALRALGHDVATTEEANNANRQISDPEVLAYAVAQGRAILTINRRDFIRLPHISDAHQGIIVCTLNTNFPAQAAKIDAMLKSMDSLAGQLIRVNRGD